MEKKDQSIPDITKRLGQRTEGPISNLLNNSSGPKPPFVTDVEELSRLINLNNLEKEKIAEVCLVYPLKIPFFYANLFHREDPSCPLKRQSIPSHEELKSNSEADPLEEKKVAITPALLRRYPNRAVFLVSNNCALFCRFCNRKRFFLEGFNPFPHFDETFRVLKREKGLQEIILSGGDPLMLEEEVLEDILKRLKRIEHIRILRISSRVPVVFPERMSPFHYRIFKGHKPLWFVIHINHPKEVTEEFKEISNLLRESGCILVSQTVLLRGVNDCPFILKKLFEELVVLGIKPYYLFQLDSVKGTEHFKVPIRKGIEIMKFLRMEASGLAIPHYVMDIPSGLGKVPIEHGYIGKLGRKRVYVRSPSGKKGIYMDDGEESKCLNCGFCRDPE